MAAVVSLSDQAISTSGDYQKFFTDAQGRRLCHIIDPKTGWPVQHNVGGVSVVAADNMTADALATTLYVLGPEAGLRFIESWTNAAALFIVREVEGKFRLDSQLPLCGPDGLPALNCSPDQEFPIRCSSTIWSRAA